MRARAAAILIVEMRAPPDGSTVVGRDLRIERDVVPPREYPMLRAIFETTVEDARSPLVLVNGAS